MSSYDDRPVLPDRPDDEHDVGWGDASSPDVDVDVDSDDEATRQLLADRPPHHLDRGD